ncbi:hypothetical protein ROLI_013230 [Roseobacter fucihabitans]|uniref:Uncharacterized protein n=1 Tax=Roseobacter fucihabitans TaxID=1537242 RepID=A0ABZ2BQN1_9RHOB|nr:hypothetical protein [Roseobacter litoralis]MBC6968129.1 hypothetical protein [Roseobacter litoralis]
MVSDGFENFANAAIGLSAFAGAAVAFFGLSEWKQQRKWDKNHDLAHRYLLAIFEYRDAISGVRNPGMFAYEMPEPDGDTLQNMSDDQVRFYGIQKAYQNRWDKVTDANKKLYPIQLEAEAYWGAVSKDLFRALRELEIELQSNITTFLRASNPDNLGPMRAAADRRLQKRR